MVVESTPHYKCVIHSFDLIQNASLFASDIGEDEIDIIDIEETLIELVMSDSIQKKYTKFDIEEELQLSVLAGMVTLNGSGAYFAEERTRAGTNSMSLIYKLRNVKEEIPDS